MVAPSFQNIPPLPTYHTHDKLAVLFLDHQEPIPFKRVYH